MTLPERICDPHHHLWDRRDSHYLVAQLGDDLATVPQVTRTVFVECSAWYRDSGPEHLREVGETEWVAEHAQELNGGDTIQGIVGATDLRLGERVQPVLEALQAASPNRFRGIRHSVTWDPHPEVENTAAHKAQGQLASDQFRAGARVLARMGLSLEGWCFESQLQEMAAFAKAVPELTIILNHVGGWLRTGPYADKQAETMESWRKGMAAVAQCPNVVVKLGGLGMVRCGFDWHTREKPIGSEELASAMAPCLTYCIEQFTPSRCMFESNFPVDKVSFSYSVMWNAFKRFSQGYSAAERAAMFHDTAARAYRI
jgi:predicted TIM-barrel fold metal-dependent hydrolase